MNPRQWSLHLFSQNPATYTENSAQSRSEHIWMELTLFVYNINSQYFCIKSGLNYLRYKRYKTHGNLILQKTFLHFRARLNSDVEQICLRHVVDHT